MWPTPTGPGARFRLEIRDALTRRAPSVPIWLHARHSGEVDSVLIKPESLYQNGTTVTLDNPTNTGGPFEVTLTAKDHLPWRFDDVWLEWGCPDNQSPILRAWLMPSGH
jgi:hypothetical protein